MDRLVYTALSGLKSQMSAQATIANNIANASTIGYRADRGIAWTDAARLLWRHTLVGVVLTLVFAGVSWCALLLALPFTLGMMLAIPLCVVSADPRFSACLRERGIAATPEELTAARSRLFAG